MNLSDCDITVRTWSCLKRAGINTTEELSKLTDNDLMNVRNLSRKSLQEVIELRRNINTNY
jgi:DNA-directed RNA polymerase subunit alpha